MALTLGFVALDAAIGLLVLGPGPFEAFLRYQLPRLSDGRAFAFFEQEPFEFFFVSRNWSIYGLSTKLRALGLEVATPAVGRALANVYGLALVILTAAVARRRGERLDHLRTWLALLALATLRSPLASTTYVTSPFLVLLATYAAEIRGRVSVLVVIVGTWALVLGPPPLPFVADILVTGIGQGLGVALAGATLLRNLCAGRLGPHTSSGSTTAAVTIASTTCSGQ